MSLNDHAWMARALRLAQRGLYTAHPNPRVGCVLVRDDQLIAEGWHQRTGEAHAEAAALNAAGEAARGCTAYVTLEPCAHFGRTPPCADALIAAGVARVVIGATDPNPRVNGGGVKRLRDAGIKVVEKVLADECAALNVGFNQRMRSGRPWVRVKLAVSLDGRTALADGTSQWISGQAARADVQRWRARSSAILSAIGTVLADDPSLNVRDPGLRVTKQPDRVIVDSGLRMPATARMLGLDGCTRVFTASRDPARTEALKAAGAEVEYLPAASGQADLAALMTRLGELEINELLVEAGPGLCGALLDRDLVDELVLFQAAHVLGADARGMFATSPLASMADRPQFELKDLRRVGEDLRLIYTRS